MRKKTKLNAAKRRNARSQKGTSAGMANEKRATSGRSSLARGSASSVKGWLAFNYSNPWHYTFSRTRKECWDAVLKNLCDPEKDRASFTVRKVIATTLG